MKVPATRPIAIARICRALNVGVCRMAEPRVVKEQSEQSLSAIASRSARESSWNAPMNQCSCSGRTRCHAHPRLGRSERNNTAPTSGAQNNFCNTMIRPLIVSKIIVRNACMSMLFRAAWQSTPSFIESKVTPCSDREIASSPFDSAQGSSQ